MFAMAMFTAVSYFLRDFNTFTLFILFTLLACFAGYDESLGNFLYLSRFIVFYPFYLLGQITNKEKIIVYHTTSRSQNYWCYLYYWLGHLVHDSNWSS